MQRDTGLSRRRAARTYSSIRSEEHTSELQSLRHLVCRLLLEKKKHDARICKVRNALDQLKAVETVDTADMARRAGYAQTNRRGSRKAEHEDELRTSGTDMCVQ